MAGTHDVITHNVERAIAGENEPSETPKTGEK